jgi:hypothetical protein
MTTAQAVLEAIAYGGDPRLTPSDSLRALELLQQAGTEAGGIEGLVARMSDEQLAAELEAMDPPPCWPELLPQLLKSRTKVADSILQPEKPWWQNLIASPPSAWRPRWSAAPKGEPRPCTAPAALPWWPTTTAQPMTKEGPDAPNARRQRVPKGLTQADLDRPWRRGNGSIFRPRGLRRRAVKPAAALSYLGEADLLEDLPCRVGQILRLSGA